MKKPLNVLTVVHLGKYQDGMIVDDNCPACNWAPPSVETPNEGGLLSTDPDHLLGQIWTPGHERGCGGFFQIFHCQNCGIVYATHLN